MQMQREEDDGTRDITPLALITTFYLTMFSLRSSMLNETYLVNMLKGFSNPMQLYFETSSEKREIETLNDKQER